jgi:hypothetical protein
MDVPFKTAPSESIHEKKGFGGGMELNGVTIDFEAFCRMKGSFYALCTFLTLGNSSEGQDCIYN